MRQAPSKEHSNCSKKSTETAPIQRRPAPPSPLSLSSAQAAHHHHHHHHHHCHHDITTGPLRQPHLQSPAVIPAVRSWASGTLPPPTGGPLKKLSGHQWSARSISPYPHPQPSYCLRDCSRPNGPSGHQPCASRRPFKQAAAWTSPGRSQRSLSHRTSCLSPSPPTATTTPTRGLQASEPDRRRT